MPQSTPLLTRRRLEWLLLATIALACGLLCYFEYRWTGELAEAERVRLKDSMGRRSEAIASELDASVRRAITAFLPNAEDLERLGREKAHEELFRRWEASDAPRRWFTRIAVATRDGGTPIYHQLDLKTGRLTPTPWPKEWQEFADSIAGERRGMPSLNPAASQFEFPVFAPEQGEMEWVLFDLDERELSTYLAEALGTDTELRLQIRAGAIDGRVVAPAGEPALDTPDAVHTVLSFDFNRRGGRPPERQFNKGAKGNKGGKGKGGRKGGGPRAEDRFFLLATAKSGTLDALVSRHRWRNFAVATALALVLFSAAAALLRYTRRANEMAAMQFDFLTGVTHELRTPLTVIRTAAHNLERDVIVDREKTRKYATLIRENGEHLTSMVEQILEYARRKEHHNHDEWEPVDLRETVQEGAWAAKGDLEESRSQLDLQLPEEDSTVQGERIALVRVVQNLVANAAKHGAANQTIEVRLTAEGTDAVLTVADRGPGMTSEELSHAFTAFYRGHEARMSRTRGTGLGLSLVDEIVRTHKGTITLANRPEGGLLATVRLPRMPQGEQQ